MARLVLTDASPLIGLSLVDGLPWLAALFGEVWMPEEVRNEVLSGSGFPGEQAIRGAMGRGWLRLWSQPVGELPLPDLDEGEAACIRIAVGHAGESLVLMDERAGGNRSGNGPPGSRHGCGHRHGQDTGTRCRRPRRVRLPAPVRFPHFRRSDPDGADPSG